MVDFAEDRLLGLGLLFVEFVRLGEQRVIDVLRNAQDLVARTTELLNGLQGLGHEIFMLFLRELRDDRLDDSLEVVRQFFPGLLVDEEHLRIAGRPEWATGRRISPLR